MRFQGSLLTSTVALVLAGSAASAQPAPPATRPTQSWELVPGGRWQQVNTPKAAPVTDETLDRVEEMLQNKQGQAAKRIAVAWLRTHKDSPIRDRGVYLLGQANFLYGDRISSFYNFEEVLDYYPDSRYFYPSLERQYDIADQFLKGYKRRFLGLPLMESHTEATEMLYRIQQRAPGSPLAEKALLRVADFYYARAEYDLAGDAYAAFIRSYPRNPLIPRVRLRQAFSALAQFRGIRFDSTPVIDARQQLLDLARAHPQLAEEENVAAIIARVDTALAQKLLVTADFYKRTHKPVAAAYYYRYLMRQYPDSPEAQQAAELIKRLPPAALREPEPEVAPPATLPAKEDGRR